MANVESQNTQQVAEPPTAKFGRRYSHFPRGDVFVVELEPNAVMRALTHPAPEPMHEEDQPPAPETVQFHTVREAEQWVKQASGSLAGRKLAVVTIRRIFDIEVVKQPKLVVRQQPKLGSPAEMEQEEPVEST